MNETIGRRQTGFRLEEPPIGDKPLAILKLVADPVFQSGRDGFHTEREHLQIAWHAINRLFVNAGFGFSRNGAVFIETAQAALHE
jgi:hypothetical protein